MTSAVAVETFGFRFKEVLDELELNQNDVAKKAGIGESLFSKVLKHGRESDFDKILETVKYVATIDESLNTQELMLLYIKDLENYDNVKVAMEYCDTHNYLDQLQKLCNFCYGKNNEKNRLKEWADFYSLSIQRKLGKITMEAWNVRIIELKPYWVEMQIYRLLSIHGYNNYKRRWTEITKDMAKLKELIESVKNPYMRFSLGARLDQYRQVIYVRAGEFDRAEEISKGTIKKSPGKHFNALAFVTLADRNIQDKNKIDKVIDYFEKAIEIYREVDDSKSIHIVEYKMHFAKLIHGIDVQMEELHYEPNIAFKHILDGNADKGLIIIDRLEREYGRRPLYDYIRGRATRDKNDFWDSLCGFIDENDRLYGFFPMIELLRLGSEEGVDEDVVKRVYKINKQKAGELDV
ncbi:AimR family lysis-lysogeny pheromone receptor [Cytobacillus sp. Hm23]